MCGPTLTSRSVWLTRQSAASAVRMSKIRHIFRLFSQGRSKLSIATQTGVSRNTVKRYLTSLLAASR
ncbi:helix-turn-helix domain-containing protein [Larkinella sp. VNQ87]|uniref:helix-turn-helix domain-containing protein n=1 Tax=Larkinella sp. VNQ87 TaxID=3400921 RepID=UPI003C101269